MFCLSVSLKSFLESWEIFKIENSCPEMVFSEEDFNKMVEVIRSCGLKEEVDGDVLRWIGTREEIREVVDKVMFESHSGPSYEEITDEEFEEFIEASVSGESQRLTFIIEDLEG
jgi:hypothetical protein